MNKRKILPVTISILLVLVIVSLSAIELTPVSASPAIIGNENLYFENGVFYMNGRPNFLWSADYPYYRDNRNNWSARLDKLKDMNVKIITCYIPWRHHAPTDPLYGNGIYDFTGQTMDSRDLKYFLDLIENKGLYAIVKPGPFIWAEVDYGGLPNYVIDAINAGKIEPDQDSSGLPNQYVQPLGHKVPAALDPYYLTYVKDWLKHVNDFIVGENYLYPNGPIIGMQLLNEGIYSNARERVTGFKSYDWSYSSRKEFRNFLKERYGNLDNYNAYHGTSYDGAWSSAGEWTKVHYVDIELKGSSKLLLCAQEGYKMPGSGSTDNGQVVINVYRKSDGVLVDNGYAERTEFSNLAYRGTWHTVYNSRVTNVLENDNYRVWFEFRKWGGDDTHWMREPRLWALPVSGVSDNFTNVGEWTSSGSWTQVLSTDISLSGSSRLLLYGQGTYKMPGYGSTDYGEVVMRVYRVSDGTLVSDGYDWRTGVQDLAYRDVPLTSTASWHDLHNSFLTGSLPAGNYRVWLEFRRSAGDDTHKMILPRLWALPVSGVSDNFTNVGEWTSSGSWTQVLSCDLTLSGATKLLVYGQGRYKMPGSGSDDYGEVVLNVYRKNDGALVENGYNWRTGVNDLAYRGEWHVIHNSFPTQTLPPDNYQIKLEFRRSGGDDTHYMSEPRIWVWAISENIVGDYCNEGWDEIEPPRNWGDPTSKNAALTYLDWGEYSSQFFNRVFSLYKSYMENIPKVVPVVTNFNAVYGYYTYDDGIPLSADDRSQGEAWLTRINPELTEGVDGVYGYTDWVDTPAYDKLAYHRHLFTITRHRGPCMEANWGYSVDAPLNYCAKYKYTQPVFFDTVQYTAFGSTGVNVYIAVSTDNWTDELDTASSRPHPPDSPIAENGTPRNKYWTAQQFGLFFEGEGENMVRTDFRQSKIAWGVYPPYAWADAWNIYPAEWQDAGFYDVPRSAYYGLDGFQCMLKKKDTEFTQVNIKDAPLAELQKVKIIFLSGYDWMDAKTQDKLVAYVNNGGVLVLCDRVPTLDENFQSYTNLKNTLYPCSDSLLDLPDDTTTAVNFDNGAFTGAALWRTRSITLSGNAVSLARLTYGGNTYTVAYRMSYGSGKAIFLGFHPWVNPYSNDGDMITKNTGLVEYLADNYAGAKRLAWDNLENEDVDVQQLINTKDNVIYVFVLTHKETVENYKIWYTDINGTSQYFHLKMTRNSAAIIGINKNNTIRSTIIRAINDVDNVYTKPVLSLGSGVVQAFENCDIMLSKWAENKYVMSVTNVMSANKSTIVRLPLPTATNVIRVNTDGTTSGVSFTVIGSNIEFTAYDTQSGVARYEIWL